MVSKYIRERCSELGIQPIHSSPYHPQANGMIESFHRVLGRGLALLQTSGLSLERATASILYVYRTTPHSSTGQTPAFLAMGCHPTFPLLQCMEKDVKKGEGEERSREIEILRADAVHRICLRFQAKGQHRAKQGRAKHESIKKDDIVLCRWTKKEKEKRNKLYGAKKLAPAWSEPRRVVEVLVPGKQLLVQSIWLKSPPRKVSIHDVRKVLPESDEASRRANLEYLLRCARLQVRGGQRAHLLEKRLKEKKEAKEEASREFHRRNALAPIEEGKEMDGADDAMEIEREEEGLLATDERDVVMESPPPSRRMSVVVEVGGEAPPATRPRAPTTEEGISDVHEDWDAGTLSEGGCVFLATMGSRGEEKGGRPPSDARSLISQRSQESLFSTRRRPLVSALFSLSGPGVNGAVCEPMSEWLNIRAAAESTASAWGEENEWDWGEEPDVDEEDDVNREAVVEDGGILGGGQGEQEDEWAGHYL
eukprot:GHVU01122590.1.p1 GENE.GHVU01122590.1~~GHVU01122590.1.p1  ORF type:complete len:552 (-),score=86.31 GHVU01122590.1:279-1718(-)